MLNFLYIDLLKSRSLILEDIRNKAIIYQFINLSNNKSYVGSTVNGARRFEAHLNPYNQKRTLKKGDNLLYKAFNKYGLESFGFKVLEIVDFKVLNDTSKDQTSETKLSKLEQKTLILNREDFFTLTLKPEYNLRKKAGSNLGIIISKETRKKMSLAKIGKASNILGVKLSDRVRALFREKSGRAKSINMFNQKDELIATFKSIQIASENLNINRNKIAKCLSGLRKHTLIKGEKFIFRYNVPQSS